MMEPRPHGRERRALLRWALALPAMAAMTRATGARGETLAPTPACAEGDEPTPRSTEGPFFRPDSPQRTSLIEPGMDGTLIVLEGLVLTTACRPAAGALFDIWHCDAAGNYDNRGYRLRGHQLADADGRYRLETIVPGAYPGRTRHFHVKVQAPGGRLLTTQLYFPGEPGNARDRIFLPALVMAVASGAGGLTGRFDFIVA